MEEAAATAPQSRLLGVAVALIAIAMSLYHMYVAGFGPPEAMIFRGTHLLFALTLVFLLYPSMGDLASLKAFSVVILGGLGNFAGAALGGLLLGVAEELGAGYISSGYRDAVGFAIIVVMLMLRPSGLFRRAERVG